MQKVTLGILAHVDSGKTTLSEGLLYASGALRKLGRVDHGDAFLDTDALERERGITIFSKQAMLFAGDKEFTLLDTPGHVDFSAEMERTLSVLDYAVLVISGSDGVQSHTRTLWRLLTRYEVPTFLFINKMDLAGADKDALLRQLTATLSAECVDFSASQETRDEALALCDEAALEQLLERGKIDDALIAEMVKNRKVFPCFFGSALKLDGVEDFLTALACFTREPVYPKEFGAKVFKISRDAQGARLTWLKVTGGALRVKAPLTYRAQNQDYNEKADQLRLYSGVKFRALEEAGAGSVVAVTGLSHSYVGLGLGAEAEASAPLLQPVLTYQLILPDGADAHSALIKLRELEEEDPMLRIVWGERYGQIHVQLMGKIQLEILRRRIRPFLLRRLKGDVLRELPEKVEITLTADMTEEQRRVYQASLLRLRPQVEGMIGGNNRIEMLAAITELRQICGHPSLVLPSYAASSGKLDMLLDVLPGSLEAGHRALVFSQFTRMLKILQRRLEAVGISCMYLDGETPPKRRVEMVQQFNAGEGQVFLISLKAGGSGLNLVGADTVIHFDPWWNPAAEDQATDRAHRIGQKHKVTVIRMITRGSIEEQVVKLGARKREMFDQMITAGEAMPTQLTPEDIRALFD